MFSSASPVKIKEAMDAC